MFHIFVLFSLCWISLTGVSGVVEKKSVIEGDSVTLNTSVSKIQADDIMLWKYGAEGSLLIAYIEKRKIFSTYNGTDGRFRKGLKLNHQTGSLTITSITTEHTGDYELHIFGAKDSSKTIRLSVYARLSVPAISRNCSSPSSCSVVCAVVNVSHVNLSWLKGNSLLSSISVSDLSISLSLPLEVEDQDTNNYSCVLNSSITHQTTHLDISDLCQTCEDQDELWLRILLIAAAGSPLIVAVIIICCICKKKNKSRKRGQTGKEAKTSRETNSRNLKSKKLVYENVPKRR